MKFKKSTVFFVTILILIIFSFTAQYRRENSLRIKSTNSLGPFPNLSLIPRGILKGNGNYLFPLNQDLTVDIMLTTGSEAIDSAQALVNYDPTVVNVKSVLCNSSSDLKNALLLSNQNGKIDVACTAIPLPPYQNPDTLPAYTPAPPNSQQVVATLVLEVIQPVSSSSLVFDYISQDPNSSSVIANQGTTNILASVENLTFDATSSQNTATLSLIPNNGTYSQGSNFNVDIILSTGQYQIDSSDVIIHYDKDVLRATSLTPGSIFTIYPRAVIDPTLGIIELTGQIAAADNTQPFSGQNLTMGTITFEPLAGSLSTPVTFEFSGIGDRNDSNISEFGQGNDVLTSVTNASFTITGIQTTPTVGPSLAPIPTATSVPTATPTPTTTAPISLKIKLTLQGRTWTGAPLSRGASLKVLGTGIDIKTSTNAFGELLTDLLSLILPGPYDLLIKPDGYLQKKFNVDLITGTNTLDLSGTTLLAGDVDNSGKINSLDYNMLMIYFKTNDSLTDLDGSGQVNSLDFSLLIGNWNKSGDNEGQ